MTTTAVSHLPVPPGAAGVQLVASAVQRLLVDAGPSVELTPPGPPPPPSARDGSDHPALVVRTSGSTGTAHRVLLPLTAVLASADRGQEALGPPGRWLTAIPVTGIGGVLTVVRALRAGQRPVAWPGVGGSESFTAASFRTTAEPFLAAARTDSLPAFVSLVPTQLRRILADPSAADLLAGFTAVLVGGSALPTDLRAAAESASVRVVATYGATETAGGVVFDGLPLPDVLVTVESDSGAIVIGGPTVARGYLDDFDSPAFDAGGFRTGDRGQWRDGRLVVRGRFDDIIKVGGIKVSLTAVTEVLRADPRVRDAHVVARPSHEWGTVPHAYVVLVDPGAPDPRDALRAEVGRALGRRAQPPTMSLVPEIPVTAAGKPIRES